jgi:PEGA domain
MREIFKAALLAILIAAWSSPSFSQETESAVITPSSGFGARVTKPPVYSATGPERTPAQQIADRNNSAYMIAPKGPPPQEVNRKDLEDNAGPNAGKLLLRSVPDGADIFINGRVVGQTPMLLIVAPGKYKIDMRGPREGFGSKTIGLIAKDTQTVVVDLKQRYPSQVRAF